MSILYPVCLEMSHGFGDTQPMFESVCIRMHGINSTSIMVLKILPLRVKIVFSIFVFGIHLFQLLPIKVTGRRKKEKKKENLMLH
jgi:hypothetical protein